MLDRRSTIKIAPAAALVAGRSLPTLAADKTPFRHVVMFNFKDDVPEARRQQILPIIKSQGDLPGVKSFFMSHRIGPKTATSPFEYLLILDFASEDDSTTFQTSSAHDEHRKEFFTPYRSDLLTLDLHQPLPRAANDTKGIHFRHTVMWNYKPHVTAAEVERLNANRVARLSKLPQVKGWFQGKNVSTLDMSPMNWLVIADFASEEEHAAWQKEPTHRSGTDDEFTPNRSELIVLDVRM